MLRKIKSFLLENTSAKQTVAKNTIWLSISNFGGRLVKAAVVIYGARVLGTAGWGLFSYAVTLASFFTLFVDPGLNAIVMRDAGTADEERKKRLFSTTLALKLALVAIMILFIIFVGPFFSTLPGAKALLPIVALIMTFDTLREFLSSFVRAMEKMEWEAGIFLLTNVSIVIAGGIFLFLSPTARSFGWGYAAGTAIGAIAAIWVIRPYLKKIFAYFSPNLILPLLKTAWPFAIIGALGLLLTNTDILIISWMRTASDVGLYSAAIRIIQILYLIPYILQFSTLPLLSRLAKSDAGKFRMALERTIRLAFLVSIPVVAGTLSLGTPVMRFVFGSTYAAAGLAFTILMLGILVDYPATIVSAAVFAYNHQRSLILASLIAGTSNVILDLILIPRFGIVGSAIATLIAMTFSNWYLWRIMKKLNYFTIFPHLGKVIVSGIITGTVSWILLALHLNVVLIIAMGALCYILLLKALREPLLKEIIATLRGNVLSEQTAHETVPQ